MSRSTPAPQPDVLGDSDESNEPIFTRPDPFVVDLESTIVDKDGPQVTNLIVPVFSVTIPGSETIDNVSEECADALVLAHNAFATPSNEPGCSTSAIVADKKLIGFRTTSPKKNRNQKRWKGAGGWHSNPRRKQSGYQRKYTYRGPACMLINMLFTKQSFTGTLKRITSDCRSRAVMWEVVWYKLVINKCYLV